MVSDGRPLFLVGLGWLVGWVTGEVGWLSGWLVGGVGRLVGVGWLDWLGQVGRMGWLE